MNGYLLDTNIIIRYLNGRAPAIQRNLAKINFNKIKICSVVKAELFFGAARSQKPARNLAEQKGFLQYFESFPFDDLAAEQYAKIRAELSNQGTPIGPNDLMIAAIAITHNLTLVTANTNEFKRVKHLEITNWEVD